MNCWIHRPRSSRTSHSIDKPLFIRWWPGLFVFTIWSATELKKKYLGEGSHLDPPNIYTMVTPLLRSPRALAGSSQRDSARARETRDGWRQRVPILSERKGEIAAKSCSYAHNRRMSHPRMHLQHVGGPDTEDNDRVCHPQTATTTTKRIRNLEFALLVEVPRDIAAEMDSADCTVMPSRNK